MKKILFSLFAIAALLLSGCGKEEDEVIPPECYINGFGVIRVNFAATNVQHKLSINSREKIVPAGQGTDTIRIYPGSHVLTITGPVSDSIHYGLVVRECAETLINIP